MSTDEVPKEKPGPEAERLKVEPDWENAVKKALRKEKPPEGWPAGGAGEGNPARQEEE